MRLFIISLVFTFGIAWSAKREDPGSGMYSPLGKRDPFKPPKMGHEGRGIAALGNDQKFGIDRLVLRAIVRHQGKAQAMFEDPDGRSHIVREGDLLGREKGTVSRILDTEVIVTEKTFNYLGAEVLYEKVMSLPRDENANGGPDLSNTVVPKLGRATASQPK